MKLPDLRDFDLTGKKVLVRADFDVPLKEVEGEISVADETRITQSFSTIDYLLVQQAKIILLAHLGRPEGRVVPELSLVPVAETLSLLLKENIARREDGWQIGENLFLRENLRFNPGEEANNPGFAQELASLGDFYLNDAFAVCHREHASIVALPQQFKSKSKNSVAAGLSLLREVEVLSSILENPKRPVVVILGGVKEDKFEVAEKLTGWADYILIGGKLSLLISNIKYQISNREKVIIADLNEEGKDITLETVEKFGEVISRAGTIIWAGPMGQYEEDPTSPTASLGAGKWEVGTREIGRMVINSGAFTVVGGGDTEAALTKFGLVSKIDFVSSGGGAMLAFLARGDLPGLAALREL